MRTTFAACFAQVGQQAPLVHCISNLVSANDCANIVLAAGASPIMADDPEEAAEYLRSRKVGVQLKKLGEIGQILPELSERNSRLELDTSVGCFL